MTMALQTSYSQTPATGLPGVPGAGPKFTLTCKNADTASMPWGTPVAFKPSSATSDYDVTVPANSSDAIKAIVIRNDNVSRAYTNDVGTFGDLDSVGLRPGVIFDGMQTGLIQVTCITGCVPGDRLFVSYAVGGLYTAAGMMGNATQASTTIDCTKQAEWLSTAAAGGIAWLKVDFTNKP